MNPIFDLISEQKINHTMAFRSAFSGKAFRYHTDPEMSLAARPRTCVPFMAEAFINDFKMFRRQPASQLQFNSAHHP